MGQVLAFFRSFVAMLAIAVLPAANAAGEAILLSAAATVELGAGSAQTIEIAATPHPRLLSVDEQSANIKIELIDPEGNEASVDNRLGRGSVEFLFLAANRNHRLQLVHTDGPGASVGVNLQLTQLTPATATHWAALSGAFLSTADHDGALDRLSTALDAPWLSYQQANQLRYSLALRLISAGRLDEAAEHLTTVGREFEGDWQARTLVDLAQINFRRGELVTAEQQLEQANAIAKRHQAVWTELVSAANLCRLLQTRGRIIEARDCTAKVLTRAAKTNEPALVASLQFNLGGLEVNLANASEARAAFETALTFFKQSGNLKGQGNVAGALALLEKRLGHLQRALAFQATALDAYRRIGDLQRVALTTSNLAGLYLSSGDTERARPLVEESAALGQQLNDLRQWRRAIALLSLLEFREMNYERSELYRRQALSLAQEIGDESLILVDRLSLADTLLALRQYREAEIQLSKVSASTFSIPNIEVSFLRIQGHLWLQQGKAKQARAALTQARQLSQAADLRVAELTILVALTKLELQQGDPTAATGWVHKARELAETTELSFSDPALRLRYSQAFAQITELELRALIAAGGESLAKRSFVTAERNRARSLIDLLNRTDAVPPVPEAQLQEQLTAARERLALTRVQLEAARQFDQQQVDPLTRVVGDLRQEVELMEARVAEGYPGFPALSVPDIDLDDLQAQLEPGTWMLEYSLGDEASLAWRITGDSIELYELPPRKQLEDLARDVHDNMNPPRAQALVEQRLAQLGEVLFAPFRGDRPPTRLLLVADGALHYVPFAALPWPNRRQPLVEMTEIVHLASAQAAMLQRQVTAPTVPEKTLLLVADPVFDVSDSRLPKPQQNPGLNLSRLTQSRDEAKQIAALVGPNNVDVWLDFTANRDSLLTANLTRYKMLHLATHASSDSAFPELSGLTLSTMDASGQSINGFVGLRDLFRLQGSADLVVLSACDTALGSEVRGEGLVGLTRGFLHAGARQVIGTLWPVEDRTNTALMLEFYKAVLSEGVSVSAALQGAQRAIRRQDQHSHPFYWSGVALYGDWE